MSHPITQIGRTKHWNIQERKNPNDKLGQKGWLQFHVSYIYKRMVQKSIVIDSSRKRSNYAIQVRIDKSFDQKKTIPQYY